MMKMYHSKRLSRTGLSLALCLVLFVSLFAAPAFAANTMVIIGGRVDQEPRAAEPSSSVVVSGSGSAVGAGSSSVAAGIAADAPAAGTQVIVGEQVSNTQTQPASAVVVQPDGTIVTVGQNSAAQNPEGAAAAAPAITPAAPTGLAAELLAKVNQARSANGLATLKYSNALQSIANLRAQESTISFGHTRPDGSHCSTAVTVDWNVTGENLIQVTSAYATADLMMETWMNSPTHKYNILLDKFTDMAVGVWETNDTTFVSLIFIG